MRKTEMRQRRQDGDEDEGEGILGASLSTLKTFFHSFVASLSVHDEPSFRFFPFSAHLRNTRCAAHYYLTILLGATR